MEMLVVSQGAIGVGDSELAVVEVPELDAGAVVGWLYCGLRGCGT